MLFEFYVRNMYYIKATFNYINMTTIYILKMLQFYKVDQGRLNVKFNNFYVNVKILAVFLNSTLCRNL